MATGAFLVPALRQVLDVRQHVALVMDWSVKLAASAPEDVVPMFFYLRRPSIAIAVAVCGSRSSQVNPSSLRATFLVPRRGLSGQHLE